MAHAIGDLDVRIGEQTYTLHMGFREIGTLQQDYGLNLAPLLTQPEAGGLPDLLAFVRCVEVALTRYHKGSDPTVADDILAVDPQIVPKLLAVAFPNAVAGKGGPGQGSAPGKPKAAARPKTA